MVLIPFFISAVFAFGTATAKDIQTVILTRFFAGLFGSAPVTNTGGVLGDLWHPTQRGTAIVTYAFAVIGGAMIGPIIGGAIVQSSLRWRWTQYVSPFQRAQLPGTHSVPSILLTPKPANWHLPNVRPRPRRPHP